MVTISGAGSTYGQIPVSLKANSHTPLQSAGSHRGPTALSAPALALRPGQQQSVLVSGTGPFALTGTCGRVATTSLDGGVLHVAAREAGTCSLGLHGTDGSAAFLSIVVAGAPQGRAP
jgi:hypothetical protein